MTTTAPVDRHLGMLCCCGLLDCCHNENGRPFNCGLIREVHVHSGSPQSGWLYPWSPEEYDAWQRYLNRPDPDDYPEGTLQRLVLEAELEDWRKREQSLRLAAGSPFGATA
jgi:hypothetical protein